MIRTLFGSLCAFWIIAAGLPLDAAGPTVIAGTVKSTDGRLLRGLALLERGEIHNNEWDRDTFVGADGRFRIQVSAGGQFGLHVYSSGYLYAPNAVQVGTGKTLEVAVILVPEPTRANDPVIKGAAFLSGKARWGRATVVKLEVGDPNGDLGPQILAFNAATGQAYAMNPPRWVWSLKSNFSQGVYELQVDTSTAPPCPRPAGR